MKPKKHRLLVIGPTLGVYGGMEAFMITVAEAALEWPEFEVRLCFKLVKGCTVRDNLKRAAESNVKRVDYVERSSLQLLKTIAWCNIIHIQNTPPDIIFPAKLMGKKLFLTIHNWRRTEKNIHNVLWGYAAQLADRRWYNSRFVGDTWEPQEKSSRSDAFPTVSEFPNGWCEPEKRIGFIFLGRWIENKGIEEILRAYALNDFDTKEYPLTLLGDGPLRPLVLELIEELGLQGINLPGFVDVKTKEQLLTSSKWLLSPANTKEDMGLTPIEARSVGVPAIVTQDGGLPEAGGESALIAIPGDVNDLAKCMRIAVEMDKVEYRNRAIKESLKNYLRPIDFYRNAFLEKI